MSPVFTSFVYLFSQIFKSVTPTLVFYRRFQYIQYRAINLEDIIPILTFWGALAYAMHIFILSFRPQPRYPSMGRIYDVFPSNRVNTATKLKATSSILFKLIHWLNTDVSWRSTLPEPFQKVFRWALYATKYTISAVPIIILVT